MAQIPVVIRERKAATHPADVRCTNHGNAMNCPSANCPGIVVASQGTSDEALDINTGIMHGRIKAAVAEFERLHPDLVVTYEASHKRRK